MEVTVAQLKEILNDIPEDAILADLKLGNQNFQIPDIKRFFLLEKVATGEKFLTINRQGSHFHGMGAQSGLRILSFHEIPKPKS